MDVLLSCTTFPTTFLWECSLAGLAKFQLAQFFKKVGKKELITNPFRHTKRYQLFWQSFPRPPLMKVYLVEDSHMKHVFWQGILHVLMLDPKRVVLDENEKTTQKVVCRHNKLQCSVLLAINLFPHVSSSLSFLVGLFDELTKLFFCFGTEAYRCHPTSGIWYPTSGINIWNPRFDMQHPKRPEGPKIFSNTEQKSSRIRVSEPNFSAE